MPTCRKCKLVKAQEEFSKSSRYKSGFNTLCKQCDNEEKTARYRKNKDDLTFKSCAEQNRLMNRYGIGLLDVARMVVDQGGRCAICKTLFSDIDASWHIDHCHKTKKVRGVLCPSCNKGLGHFYDNPLILKCAAIYLERSQDENLSD